MKIAFCWTNGVRNKDRFDRWNDGLRAAMRIIEQQHEVTYHEPEDDIPEVDWILYWEAPCTHDSAQDGWKYKKLLQHPSKKALLFAGGPVDIRWVVGFDHIFVESEINEREFEAIGMPWSRAFGVNTDIFKPLDVPKTYDTVTHGTSASWKRQWLVCEAMHDKALVFGQFQKSDQRPFKDCEACNSCVMHEQPYEEANKLLNSAHVAVNCADYWGGGQRATLEAMACDLPVIVMTDSPKNREFIEESGYGEIVEPSAPQIALAVERLKGKKFGRDYVMSKWTPQHYADAILKVLYARNN
jgi:glycosyltransferase involved in cell wall biosynthesis